MMGRRVSWRMSSPSSWVIAAATRSTGLNDLLSWGLDPHTVAVVRPDAGVVALADGFRRPFARYWLSGFLADFGDGVRLATFPLLAAQLTGSPGAVAAVTAVQGLPWLLVGAGLGVIVDRTDRRRLMLVVDITRAVIIAALAAAVLAHGAGLC